jgi:NADH dehydrogenase (ubiquinone) 1 alpha subcomplex subunit 12
MSVAKQASSALGKVTGAVQGGTLTLKELLSGGGWRVIHDGNLMQQLVVKSRAGILKGEDVAGNKYFENMSMPSGMHRWVVYANKHKLKGLDPTTVPAEWHGWLHFVTDQVPTEQAFSYPIYAQEAIGSPNPTGNMEKRYLPKGAWVNGPRRRHWQKFTAWSPAAQTSVRGAVPDSS